MKNQYLRDRREEIGRLHEDFEVEMLTEEKLLTLPKAFQEHFKLCGFLGKPIAMNADVIWKDSYIKLSPNQNWRHLDTWQFNSVNPLMRTSFMKIRKMFFCGKDYYKNGQGSMKGKFLNLFTVIDAKGEEISQSALITSFCEMMMLSGYAFQEYVNWEEIDNYTVKGVLKDQGIEVSGIFHFDEEGRFSYFESDDRYYDMGNGKYEKKKFIARVNSYIKLGNHYHPKDVCVSWLLEGGEYEYFKGIIEKLEYNVK